MGKAVGGVPEATALKGAGGGEPGIGSYLARQRRLRGISLDELAARTRIPLRSLERLEMGAFDGPPDGFSRGFVRTVAAAIGLDPQDAVHRMLREPEPGRRAGGPSLRRLAWTAGLVLLGVLLGAAGLRLAEGLTAGSGAGRPPEAARLPLRKDYIRALAAEEGLLEPSRPAPSPPAAPE